MQYNRTSRQKLIETISADDPFYIKWINSMSDEDCEIMWSNLNSKVKARKKRSNAIIKTDFELWLQKYDAEEYDRRINPNTTTQTVAKIDPNTLTEYEIIMEWKMSLPRVTFMKDYEAEESLANWIDTNIKEDRILKLNIEIFQRAYKPYYNQKIMTIEEIQAEYDAIRKRDNITVIEWTNVRHNLEPLTIGRLNAGLSV